MYYELPRSPAVHSQLTYVLRMYGYSSIRARPEDAWAQEVGEESEGDKSLKDVFGRYTTPGVNRDFKRPLHSRPEWYTRVGTRVPNLVVLDMLGYMPECPQGIYVSTVMSREEIESPAHRRPHP